MHDYFHTVRRCTPPSKDWWTAFWRSGSAWRWWPPVPTPPRPLTGYRVFCSSCGSGRCDLDTLPRTPWPRCRPPAAEHNEGSDLRVSTSSLDFNYKPNRDGPDIRVVLSDIDWWLNKKCCRTGKYMTKDRRPPLLSGSLPIAFESWNQIPDFCCIHKVHNTQRGKKSSNAALII